MTGARVNTKLRIAYFTDNQLLPGTTYFFVTALFWRRAAPTNDKIGALPRVGKVSVYPI